MVREESDHLARHLEVRHVGVQQETIHTVEFQADMTVQHVIDVCHVRHDTKVPA